MSKNVEYTEEQLEQMLAKKKAAKKAKREKERKEYEKNRDESVIDMTDKAKILGTKMVEFKKLCHELMDHQSAKLKEYGSMNKNSKGGFSITHSSGELRVTRTRSTQPHWDERSQKAVELIKDFLGDTVKKRDQDLYEILISFIQKNEKGDLEYDKVMHLLSHEDKFTDKRWMEGLKLIKESYSVHVRGYGYEFKVKDDQGKWLSIPLNFSSI